MVGRSPGSPAAVTGERDAFVGSLFINHDQPRQPIYLLDGAAWRQGRQRLRGMPPRTVYLGRGEPSAGGKLNLICPPRYQWPWWVRWSIFFQENLMPEELRVLLSTFALLFVAELGDKTQLAVISMTAKHKSPLWVFVGATLALMAVTALGVLGGELLTRFVPELVLRRLAALLFVAMGLLMWFGKL